MSATMLRDAHVSALRVGSGIRPLLPKDVCHPIEKGKFLRLHTEGNQGLCIMIP
jgi:hypothetical protein